jgi:hypothetical protein
MRRFNTQFANWILQELCCSSSSSSPQQQQIDDETRLLVLHQLVQSLQQEQDENLRLLFLKLVVDCLKCENHTILVMKYMEQVFCEIFQEVDIANNSQLMHLFNELCHCLFYFVYSNQELRNHSIRLFRIMLPYFGNELEIVLHCIMDTITKEDASALQVEAFLEILDIVTDCYHFDVDLDWLCAQVCNTSAPQIHEVACRVLSEYGNEFVHMWLNNEKWATQTLCCTCKYTPECYERRVAALRLILSIIQSVSKYAKRSISVIECLLSDSLEKSFQIALSELGTSNNNADDISLIYEIYSSIYIAKNSQNLEVSAVIGFDQKLFSLFKDAFYVAPYSCKSAIFDCLSLLTEQLGDTFFLQCMRHSVDEALRFLSTYTTVQYTKGYNKYTKRVIRLLSSVVSHCPQNRNSLLFSSTDPMTIRGIINRFTLNYIRPCAPLFGFMSRMFQTGLIYNAILPEENLLSVLIGYVQWAISVSTESPISILDRDYSMWLVSCILQSMYSRLTKSDIIQLKQSSVWKQLLTKYFQLFQYLPAMGQNQRRTLAYLYFELQYVQCIEIIPYFSQACSSMCSTIREISTTTEMYRLVSCLLSILRSVNCECLEWTQKRELYSTISTCIETLDSSYHSVDTQILQSQWINIRIKHCLV